MVADNGVAWMGEEEHIRFLLFALVKLTTKPATIATATIATATISIGTEAWIVEDQRSARQQETGHVLRFDSMSISAF